MVAEYHKKPAVLVAIALGLIAALVTVLSTKPHRLTVYRLDPGNRYAVVHEGLRRTDRLQRLVEAGIPLKIRLDLTHAGSLSTRVVRTLRYDLESRTFVVSDSSACLEHTDRAVCGRAFTEFGQALDTLATCCLWVPPQKGPVRKVSASIVPVIATRLQKQIDMAKVVDLPRKLCGIVQGTDSHGELWLSQLTLPTENLWLRKGRDSDT